MTTAPTYSQIKARVTGIRSKHASADVIAIHSEGQWTGPRELQNGDDLIIEQCDSPLAIRIALRGARPPGSTLVVLTRLSDSEIGEEIRLRLAKRTVFHLDRWQVLRELFQAQEVEPRIVREAWMVDSLIEAAGQVECPPAPGGFLDLETAWSLLLAQRLGLSVARPDLAAILRWSLDTSNIERYRNLPEAFRTAAAEWLVQVAGITAQPVLGCLLSKTPEPLPIGLAAQVIYDARAAGKLEKALGRFEERYLGGASLSPADVDRWSAAARDVVRLQLGTTRERDTLLKRADAILREVQGEKLAALSEVLPSGFDQRLENFGRLLKEALTHGMGEPLVAAFDAVLAHDQAEREDRARVDRVHMAMRLLRWLKKQKQTPAARPQSFADAAEQYVREGGFVDWARLRLRTGDPVSELSDAYNQLFSKVTGLQEEQARLFAELLRDWTASGTNGDALVPVESALDAIVAPLAEQAPVLLVVMDGMSVAVFHELVGDIARRDWIALCQSGRSFNRPLISTLPSVTEFSRTSLLCGSLGAGNSASEKDGFAKQPSLLRACKTNRPPLLFHKMSLQASQDEDLLGDVRNAISEKDHRVVGVVINAVDDYLLKGEQIETLWRRDAIKVLPTLLHEARAAGRLVVLLSDHGHILETGTNFSAADGGDRWRPGADAREGELLLKGKRVLVEGGSVVLPWSERIRYSGKKNGYHGGASPQEVVIPLAVLSADDSSLQGWTEAVSGVPEWWDESGGIAPLVEMPTAPKKKAPAPDSLLDWREDEATTKPKPVPQWIEALLTSPVFEQQRALGGRAFPDEKLLVRLLAALDRHGGKMTEAALVRALEYPPSRMRGLRSVLQRVLNLDGYQILGYDANSETWEMDRNLLCRQFDIDEGKA
jgi:hypothetical protein